MGFDFFAYLGLAINLWLRLRVYKGRTIRTLLVIESPDKPLSAEEAQVRLVDTGAIVLPGFTLTP